MFFVFLMTGALFSCKEKSRQKRSGAHQQETDGTFWDPPSIDGPQNSPVFFSLLLLRQKRKEPKEKTAAPSWVIEPVEVLPNNSKPYHDLLKAGIGFRNSIHLPVFFG